MSKFMCVGEKNPGDGRRNPPERKLKRFFFNLWVKLTQNQFHDSRRVEGIKKI